MRKTYAWGITKVDYSLQLNKYDPKVKLSSNFTLWNDVDT